MGMPTPHRKNPGAASLIPPADPPASTAVAAPVAGAARDAGAPRPREVAGPAGPEPTRFGDWEKNGRCIDF
ncbi:MAG: DUF1674 domain-containing protein [Gammaproteobacteria bacterium]|nr:MAG: DUF1674 domain-containing protein [Gammaproteobacteria bacterium]